MNTKLYKSDIYLLSIFFIISFSIQGHEYYERNAMLREYLIDFPVEIISICSIIFLFTFWLFPQFIASKKYFLYAIIGVFIIMFFTSLDYLIGYWSGNNDWTKIPKGLDFMLYVINRGSQQIAFPFALFLTKKFYEGQNEYLTIQKQQKENELKLLRSQLNPHFLFNNLNTLDALIDSNPKKAKEYINRLSLTYRYLIQTKDSEVMELSEELEFTKNYLFLIETRFGQDYSFTIKQNTDITDKFIPTGALQCLLENVVKHNKAQKKAIKCTILINEESLVISNTRSQNIPTQESLGTGLVNLRARYQLLSNKNIEIADMPTQFSVTIPIIKLV